MRKITLICCLLLAACGTETDAEINNEAPVIVISSNHIIATPSITASPNQTIILVNYDDVPHTVTSQSSPDAFDETGIFDSVIPSQGKTVLTIPNANSGDVFNFYCRFHLENEIPANGEIIIQ